MSDGEIYIFGPFRLSPQARELLCRGVTVHVGSRAFDVLTTLLRRQGQLVTKNELMAEVWPDAIVEDNNLKVQVSALRKILSEEPECSNALQTIPGRGYRFVGGLKSTSIFEASSAGISAVDPTGSPELPNKPSIAVLPFANMSGDSEQDYFADGIVEDITTALSRFPSLFVIARTSSFTYKGRTIDIKQAGRELGVRYLVEGSVRRWENRVRVTGQLVQAQTGIHVWAERYERDLGDIFALQDDMTASIVGALVPGLQRAEMDRASQKPSESLDAYDCYLRGMAAFYTWTKEGNDKALELLERASTLDPTFVPAVVLAENCWGLRYTQGWSPVAEAVEQSTRLARLAVQLDPDNAEALAVLARRTASINHDYHEATSLAERAGSINPNSAFALRHGAWAFLFAGQPERGNANFERAMRLSPRDPRAHDSLSGVALALIQLGRDVEAVAAARKALQHNRSFASAWRMLAAALALSGEIDEAREATRRVFELDPTCSLTTMYIRFGHSEKARARFYDGLRRAGVPD